MKSMRVVKRLNMICFILLVLALPILLSGCLAKQIDIAENGVVNNPIKNNDECPRGTKAPVKSETKFVDRTQTKRDENMRNEKGAVKAEDVKLFKGKLIFIDPGHQAKSNSEKEPLAPSAKGLKEKVSSGTAGVASGVPEYRLTLQVSFKLREELEKHGAKVIMSREKNNVNISNAERAKLANDSKADIVIRIHADGSDNGKAKGVSLLYPGNKYITDKKVLKDSKLAAQCVLNRIVKSTGAVSRGIVERNDLTGFNWSTLPVILVEMGFMTNKDEDRLMNSQEYQGKMVKGITLGIADYFALK